MTGCASAGTVTLTGSCVRPDLAGNFMLFNISNSGNDTAYGMRIIPFIFGAAPANSTYYIDTVPPGSQHSLNVSLHNIANGTYSAHFVAVYQQGSEVFTVLFPCVVSFFSVTHSQIYVSPTQIRNRNGSTTVKVELYNAGSDSVAANVSLVLSPAVSVSARSHSVTIPALSSMNVSFNVDPPSGSQVDYTAAAVAQYDKGGLGYVSQASFQLSSLAGYPDESGAISPGTVVFAGAIAAILVLAALLIFVQMRNRKKQQR
ncbi:Uncharacterised protein [uncultured archaeon]|nr:Uncharacterised protein [uncultured archaeon]